jgi:hypothetical protein
VTELHVDPDLEAWLPPLNGEEIRQLLKEAGRRKNDN